MHELGITQRILEVALERAERAGASTISAVYLEIGVDSDVAPESLRFYWPRVTQSTAAENAELVIEPAVDPRAFRMTAIDAGEGARPRTRAPTSPAGPS